MPTTVSDLLNVLNQITGGRCITSNFDINSGAKPFIVTKTSNIPGKAVTELPGLVWGKPDKQIKKIAVLMTMTESHIELARGLGVDALVTHHPVAEGSNSGGVIFKHYLGTYDLAVFELHEAFHGMHRGIPWLHGYMPTYTNIAYGGFPGNVVNVGEALPSINTLGDLLDRLERIIDLPMEDKALEMERAMRGIDEIQETCVLVRPLIYKGERGSPVKTIAHIHPHTGFTPDELRKLKADNPGIDTLVLSISRVYPGHELLKVAEELGLNVLCGTSHALEIYENGVPLARAIQDYLPDTEVLIFRDRVTSVPLDKIGSPALREYGQMIADQYLKKGMK